LLQLFKVNYSK